MGRRIIKAIELSRANANGEETESANEKVLDPDYVEGLGRVLTGVNARIGQVSNPPAGQISPRICTH